jgi:hypothetical protein
MFCRTFVCRQGNSLLKLSLLAIMSWTVSRESQNEVIEATLIAHASSCYKIEYICDIIDEDIKVYVVTVSASEFGFYNERQTTKRP